MLFRFYILFLVCCLFPLPLAAQNVKTFTVLPFTLHGPQTWQYLENAVPDMLKTRLTVPKKFISRQAPNNTAIPTTNISDTEASELCKKLDTDYLIWGTLTVIEKNCSLDIQTITAKGEKKPFSANGKIDDLIGSLETVNNQIKTTVFCLPPIKQPTSADDIFLYKGEPGSDGRWQTQLLDFPSRGMLICDADGDGKQEIFLLKEKGVTVYRLEQHRLLEINEFSFNHRYTTANINFLPNKNGKYIVVSAIANNKPSSCILTFSKNKLKAIVQKIPYFLGVIKNPPLYRPTLFGQKRGISQFLQTDSIVELTLNGNQLLTGRKLKLPDGGNIFNLTFLPQGDKYKILTANNSDKLNIFTPDYKLLTATPETFAASSTEIEYNATFAGGKPNDSDNIKGYFIPTRLGVFDQEKRLLVAKNISDIGQFFKRYRSFPQSEIHALAWDGISLTTVWKTRLIKGTTVDYAISDIDGTPTLLACVNTHTGSLGIRSQKTFLLGYPLKKLKEIQNKNGKKEKK